MHEQITELQVAVRELSCLPDVGGTERLFWHLFGSSARTDTFWLDRQVLLAAACHAHAHAHLCRACLQCT